MISTYTPYIHIKICRVLCNSGLIVFLHRLMYSRKLTFDVNHKVLCIFIHGVCCHTLIFSSVFPCYVGYSVVELLCLVLQNRSILRNPGNIRCRVPFHDSSKRHILGLIDCCVARRHRQEFGFVCEKTRGSMLDLLLSTPDGGIPTPLQLKKKRKEGANFFRICISIY